jgi:ABC-type multidrug transport system fused ATPase/permease subunit
VGEQDPTPEPAEEAVVGQWTVVRGALALLSRRERRKYGIAVAGQMATAILDLAGVLLIGAVGVLAAAVAQGLAVPDSANRVLAAIGLGEIDVVQAVLVLAVAAAIVLVVKSVIYGVLMRWIARFLARCQREISARMVRQSFAQAVEVTARHSTQALVFAIVSRAPHAITILLSAVAIVLSEVTVLIVLGLALLLIDPVVTVVTIVFFGALALVIQKLLGRAAARAGEMSVEGEIAAHEGLQEALIAHRELFILGRQARYAAAIDRAVAVMAAGRAADVVVQQMPKLIYESALVVGGVALAAWQLAVNDLVTAVGTLALFLAAGFRLLPTMIRLNSQLVLMRGLAVMTRPTVDLAAELDADGRQISLNPPPPLPASAEPAPGLALRGVTFSYPGSDRPAVDDVSLDLPPGGALALVGRSGAGKSTLADLILGILEPQGGSIVLADRTPREAIASRAGSVAYVPQTVATFNTTVRGNILMGLTSEEVADDRVWEALAMASLDVAFRELPDGLDTMVGERGVRLSGGQRQRLGLARALLTRPSLLVLDEATSALDAETESDITTALAHLGGKVTTVTIAHRLSTIQFADVVAYLEDGRCVAVGTFDELRRSIDAFDRQAHLLGIRTD